MQTTLRLTTRFVSDLGETLVVRECNGLKFLCDPCDEQVSVQVPSGRHAVLICYAFSGHNQPGRDAHTVVIRSEVHGLGFAHPRNISAKVYLGQLTEGQLVDIFPAAEPLFAYAALRPVVPVLYGVATAQPVYQHAA